jgi:hypothetical protein
MLVHQIELIVKVQVEVKCSLSLEGEELDIYPSKKITAITYQLSLFIPEVKLA